MNRKEYLSDTRYAKVLEQMDLLGIMDITTTRQHKNGTIVWKLPIKNYWPGNKENATNIEVASFSTGYVRNQNSGYSNYQLNKRKFDDEYFQDYEWKTIDGEYQQVKIPGQYRKWSRKTCVMIPIEIDRLEYLISYCLKNYYIKNANRVPNGDFVPKWKLENAQNGMVSKWKYDEAIKLGEEYAQKKPEVYFDIIRQRNDRIRELEEKLDAMTECRDLHVDEKLKLDDKYKKLDEFNESLLDFNKAMNTHEVSVIVNGKKYKVV